MFELHKNLSPSKKYSFQTAVSGRTLPMSLKAFLSSAAAKERLITVDSWFGPDSVRIWSTYEGWDADCYGALIKDFVSLVDGQVKILPEFIAQAMAEDLSVCQAVDGFFSDTDSIVSCSLHTDGLTGFLDVSIERADAEFGVARAVFPANIAKGEQFNLYYGQSSKGGAVWIGDLKRSVKSYFQKTLPV